MNDDPKARANALDGAHDMLLCEVLRHGVFNRDGMREPLAALYASFAARMPEEQRLAVYDDAVAFVEGAPVVSVNALLPFIVEDEAIAIVSTAVIDFVSIGPLTDGDPMSRVKDIIALVETKAPRNPGAAFGALLHLGDARVCDLLVPLRDGLDSGEANDAVKCSTGLIHTATAEFYLDWLDALTGDGQDQMFGIVASGLALLRRSCAADSVITGNRPFPMSAMSPEQWAEAQRPIPLADFAERISGRLYALEQREPPPRTMPVVIVIWGLEPRTGLD